MFESIRSSLDSILLSVPVRSFAYAASSASYSSLRRAFTSDTFRFTVPIGIFKVSAISACVYSSTKRSSASVRSSLRSLLSVSRANGSSGSAHSRAVSHLGKLNRIRGTLHAPLGPVKIDDAVFRNPEQPRLQLARISETSTILPCLRQRLLRDVLRVLIRRNAASNISIQTLPAAAAVAVCLKSSSNKIVVHAALSTTLSIDRPKRFKKISPLFMGERRRQSERYSPAYAGAVPRKFIGFGQAQSVNLPMNPPPSTPLCAHAMQGRPPTAA